MNNGKKSSFVCLRICLACALCMFVVAETSAQMLFSSIDGQRSVKTDRAFFVYDEHIIRGNGTTITVLLFDGELPPYLSVRYTDEKGRPVSSGKAFLVRINAVGMYRCDLAIPALSVSREVTVTVEPPKAYPELKNPVDMKIAVLERNYISETISLTPSMSSLRTSPDPRKDAESAALTKLLETIDENHSTLSSDVRAAPFTEIRRTSFFGDRRIYKYSNGTSDATMHNGFDYGGNKRPIYAPADAEVVFAAPRIVTGNTVILAFSPGVYGICFHMDSISVVKGSKIRAGQLLGLNGATGLVTGPHLHWELRIATVAAEAEYLLESRNLDTEGIARLLSLPVYP